MSTWNGTYEGVPDGGDSPSTLDNSIRDFKTSTEGRMENEHDTYVADGTAGAESKDWRHKEGSARAYYQSAEPTNQPGSNGAVLGADDEGRIWVDSDTDIFYIWNGTAWVEQTFNDVDVLGDLTVTGTIFDKNGLEVEGMQMETKILSGTLATNATSSLSVTGFSFTPTAVMDAKIIAYSGTAHTSTTTFESNLFGVSSNVTSDYTLKEVRIVSAIPGTSLVTVSVANDLSFSVSYKLTVTAVRTA